MTKFELKTNLNKSNKKLKAFNKCLQVVFTIYFYWSQLNYTVSSTIKCTTSSCFWLSWLKSTWITVHRGEISCCRLKKPLWPITYLDINRLVRFRGYSRCTFNSKSLISNSSWVGDLTIQKGLQAKSDNDKNTGDAGQEVRSFGSDFDAFPSQIYNSQLCYILTD